MARLTQTWFDPDKDPSRPRVGTKISSSGKKWVIRRVEAWTSHKIIDMLANDQEPDKMGHDDVLTFQHPTRPFIMWMCWVDGSATRA